MPVLGTVIPGEVLGVWLLIDVTGDDGVQPAIRAAQHDRVRQYLGDLPQLSAWGHLVGRITQQVRAQGSQPRQAAAAPLAVRDGISCATKTRPRASTISARPTRPKVVNAASTPVITTEMINAAIASCVQRFLVSSGRRSYQPLLTISS